MHWHDTNWQTFLLAPFAAGYSGQFVAFFWQPSGPTTDVRFLPIPGRPRFHLDSSPLVDELRPGRVVLATHKPANGSMPNFDAREAFANDVREENSGHGRGRFYRVSCFAPPPRNRL